MNRIQKLTMILGLVFTSGCGNGFDPAASSIKYTGAATDVSSMVFKTSSVFNGHTYVSSLSDPTYERIEVGYYVDSSGVVTANIYVYTYSDAAGTVQTSVNGPSTVTGTFDSVSKTISTDLSASPISFPGTFIATVSQGVTPTGNAKPTDTTQATIPATVGYTSISSWATALAAAGASTPTISDTGVTSSTFGCGSGIYVAGSSVNSSSVNVAGYWCNGTWTSLTTSLDATKTSKAITVLKSGSDYYITGTVTTSASVQIVGYWKNGTWTALPSLDSSHSSAIGLSLGGSAGAASFWGSDFYVAGSSTDASGTGYPGYWKNGTWTALTNPGGTSPVATRVFVSGSNIYVSGNYTVSLISHAGYWLNGTWTDLSPIVAGKNAYAYGVALVGTDLYVHGYSYDNSASGTPVPGYWKNGTWTGLSKLDSTQSATTYYMVTSGSDIYISGQNQNSSGVTVPGYWKNDTWTALTPLAVAKSSTVNSTVISGSDVYAIGASADSTGLNIPGYWKNGTWVALPALVSGKTSSAASLLIVP